MSGPYFRPVLAQGTPAPDGARPVLAQGTPPPDTAQPVVGKKPADVCWRFTFRYWKQIEYFGLDKCEPKWMVSVLDRFAELSRTKVEDVLADRAMSNAWRYHRINWNQKNIPIAIQDLDWVPKEYRNNSDEYPLVQFQISKSLGRIVGFWDEDNIFNVVLLDPLHNIQPAKSHGYRVDPCSPLSCDYTSLLNEINGKAEACSVPGCGVMKELLDLEERRRSLEQFSVVMLKLPEDNVEYVEALINDGANYLDIFNAGVAALYQGSSK